ncbi:hypothetical protein MMC09_003888 [Bachmanniomyces sp. S44760]|nr:hypothetical protein [Bachmanniomyces sp. S44760]
MTDYSKLTVVKLKEELKLRNLPQTGLKALLVARLSEADTQAQQHPLETDESKPQEVQINTTADQPAEPELQDPQVGQSIEDAPVEDQRPVDQTSVPTGVPEAPEDSVTNTEPVISTDNPPDASTDLNQGSAAHVEPAAQDVQIPDKAEEVTDPSGSAIEEYRKNEMPVATEPGNGHAIIGETPSVQLDKNEILEDSKKRKRRSHSPMPSKIEAAQKKAKTDTATPQVMLPEDTGAQVYGLSEGTGRNHDSTVDAVEHLKEPTTSDEQHGESGQKQGVAQADHLREPTAEGQEPETSRDIPSEVPTKQGSDARFKNLFSAPSKPVTSPPRLTGHEDSDERVVSPARHPASTAVYIRNFMRPLHATTLKDHLISLANPSNSSPPSDLVANFYLDSIRTHCLVQFSSISAASRVRSALHDGVWPDERTRKPLWVDFIPEDKIKKWIEVEQDAASNKGGPSKRWEVVYEGEGNEVMAYLQEVDAARPTPRFGAHPKASDVPVTGVQGAPLGPRERVDRAPTLREAPVARADGGRGFKALDDLFKSTSAKPKLYYSPVSKPLAERRLDRLADGRGGGRGDGMRRYSFEEGLLVDRGPEYGGGRGGGYRGRGGGGYRGNRGGGDTWRDRR